MLKIMSKVIVRQIGDLNVLQRRAAAVPKKKMESGGARPGSTHRSYSRQTESHGSNGGVICAAWGDFGERAVQIPNGLDAFGRYAALLVKGRGEDRDVLFVTVYRVPET